MPKARSLHPEVRVNRRKWDHDAGFAAWCEGLSYAQIAEREGVALVSVKRAAVRERWSERRYEIEEAARRATARRAAKSIDQRIAENLKLIDASKVAYARGLQSGATTISASELAALMKVEQVLIGGPSERIAGETDGHRRSIEEIEAELAELPDDQVEAMLVADAAAQRRVLPVAGAERPVDDEVVVEAELVDDSLSAGSTASVSAVGDDDAAVADEAEGENAEPDGEPEMRGFWGDQDPHGRIGHWERVALDERGRGAVTRAAEHSDTGWNLSRSERRFVARLGGSAWVCHKPV